ncbi:hypothetical protein T440DRAFT_420661, partial [Plenodomus tracheiphilus IPT5]
MCNVIQYYFACTHSFRRRRSQCFGTKHKTTRTSTKAACNAESFLTVHVRADCGSCQLAQWEQAWKLKLQRAKSFRDKLRETSLPAYEEIESLITELENEYTQASWDTRNLFALVAKRPVARVGISDYTKVPSPLAQEVLPEDVIEPGKCKEWAEMDDNDYDEDYIASTDPMHPVSTNYSHPSDDDDGTWVLQHLAGLSEDEVTGEVDSPNGFEGSGWSWGEENLATDYLPIARHPNEGTNEVIGPSDEEQLRRDQVAEVVKSFWSIVNGNDQNPLKTPEPSLSKISDDTPSTTSPSRTRHTHPIPTTTAPSTSAMYDRYRNVLRRRRPEDPRKYYSDWLVVARYEARAFEGPEGWRICDPP